MREDQPTSDADRAHPGDGRPRRLIGREPNLTPPIEVLLRYDARVLDPASAWRLPDQRLLPTVYVADRVLVRPGAVLKRLVEVAERYDLEVVPFEADLELAAGLPGKDVSVRASLVPLGGGPRAPADAWQVVQAFRAQHHSDRAEVALDHLMTACRYLHGVPFIGSGGIGGVPFIGSGGVGGVPFIGSGGVGAASQQYAVPGLGGRMPVTWLGARPTGIPGLTGRRPVVAVLDTEIGKHDWFTDKVVERNPKVNGQVIGLGGHDSTDGEDRLEGVLDADTGHGTFIAGLIHQRCPDARILGIRIMSTAGAVREGDLLTALWQLVRRQEAAQQPGGRAEDLIDIVNLSLGYYHESPQDFAYDSALLAALLELSRLGVMVVAAAGNGSTDRWMFPAAFAPFAKSTVEVSDERVPLISAGALNPDKTVALYSNTGPWVTTYRPGVNLVSTMSPTTNGGAQATFEVTLPGYPPRATLDPDSFASGFAVWSGTSFAAPVLAGQLAAALLSQREEYPLDQVATKQSVDRAWAALRAEVAEVAEVKELPKP